jgi:hypothetical protein
MTYAHFEDAVVDVKTSADALFDFLDDQTRLGSHMEKPSMMMMGGRMTYAFDEAKGRAVGSVIRMGGGMLGLSLSVEEVVTERTPPLRKTWETRGRPRLLVIGAYRMGFEIGPVGDRQRLRVFIDYDHPSSVFGRLLAFFFARTYARWCIRRMVDGADGQFL